MASTKELRTRIKSISNTAKVTGAMQMIAASKLRKAQNSAEEFNLFSKGYDDIKNSLMGSVNFDLLSEISPLFNNEDSNKDGNILYIVMSSNRGLAGPLFGNLVKILETQNTDQASFISVGKKIEKYLSSRKRNLIQSYDMKDEFDSSEIDQLSDLVINEFTNNEYSQVKLIYTHFNSVAKQTAQVVDLLPFKEESDESTQNSQLSGHIFEPNQIDLVLDFAPKFILTIIFGAILDSLASEHAARMVAMQNATDNANELVEDLTLDLNKARQETITSELLDLVGGMSAIEEN
ncbi:MAG: ATP synthase F1 subunit gamma [Chloroflexi bacterium]|nr:ATP synthase F1 subunit gamma [Chloroflexota bacterium]|tara:strand:+ start:372 stop:1247 length:876 start_codon:yes stop_codon:yes gene_type:complete